MQVKIIGVLIVALAIIFSLTAWTENQSKTADPGLITVTGDADVRVAPDEVILTLGVETWDKNLSAAKR